MEKGQRQQSRTKRRATVDEIGRPKGEWSGYLPEFFLSQVQSGPAGRRQAFVVIEIRPPCKCILQLFITLSAMGHAPHLHTHVLFELRAVFLDQGGPRRRHRRHG